MFTVRPFDQSDSDYEKMAALDRAVWPDAYDTPDAFKSNDAKRNPAHRFGRFMLESAETLLGSVQYSQMPWMYHPDRYALDVRLHPDHANANAFQAAYDALMERLAPLDPAELFWPMREDKLLLVDCALTNQYEFKMRFALSALKVNDFDFSKYDGIEGKVKQHGVSIYSLTELQPRDPAWKQKIYDLDWEIEQDVPMAEAPTRETLEQFSSKFTRHNFDSDAWFIAVADGVGDPVGRYVGISNMWLSSGIKTKIYQGITGVSRDYRRYGIGTALKVRTVGYAKPRGITVIETENEENNPMYDLNVALGFTPMPAFVEYVKKIRELE